MHEFEQLEDAALAVLEPLKAAGLATLETYSGQMGVDDIDEITLRFPCIYVSADALSIDWANRYDKYGIDLILTVGDRNVRGSAAATRGDAKGVGIYSLLESARGLLHNKRILNSWTPARVISERAIIHAPELDICVYEAVYKLKAVK